MIDIRERCPISCIAHEMDEYVCNRLHCLKHKAYEQGRAEERKNFEDIEMGLSEEDARRIREEAYEQGKQEQILAQANHDQAVQDAYERGKADVINKIIPFIKHSHFVAGYGDMIYALHMAIDLGIDFEACKKEEHK